MNEIRIIAECGINANGQVGLAKQLIQMAKDAGAYAVKFQKRDIETVYAGQLEKPRNDGNPFGWETVGQQKQGLEFTYEEYKEIDAFCRYLRIPWFYSAWDPFSAVEMFSLFDCPYNKIASAMVTNHEILGILAEQKKYTFISTGGCTMDDIDMAVAIFQQQKTPICLMHCVSKYPCPDRDLNLNMLHTLRKAYPMVDIGYSGHEVGIYPSVMAMAMGATWIERHITLNRSMYGSDQSASMEYHGLEQLCKVANDATAIFGDGKKRILSGEAECMKKLRYWES